MTIFFGFGYRRVFGKANTFADFIIQKVINVSCSQYITPPRSKNSAGRSIVSVAPTNNEGKGGCSKCRTELSVTNLVKTFHSICQAAPPLGSLHLITFVGRDKSHFSTPNTSHV